jgi:Clr5 domain
MEAERLQQQSHGQLFFSITSMREKQRKFTTADWEIHKTEVTNLYENGTLRDLMEYMKSKHGLYGT